MISYLAQSPKAGKQWRWQLNSSLFDSRADAVNHPVYYNLNGTWLHLWKGCDRNQLEGELPFSDVLLEFRKEPSICK